MTRQLSSLNHTGKTGGEAFLHVPQIISNKSPIINILILRGSGKIAEILVASIHLHSHCDEDWQNLISDELERLTDDDA